MRLLAFCSRPAIYRIADAVKNLDVDTWIVGNHHVEEGDLAVIWQTLDHNHNRGVVAFAEVIRDKEVRDDSRNPYWVVPPSPHDTRPTVLVRYVNAPRLPLWVDDSERGTFLTTLNVARAMGGSIFTVTQDQWGKLIELAGGWNSPTPEETNVTEQIRYRTARYGGQGFGLTAKERQAVERHAMGLAENYFRQIWDTVMDVSAIASYDLHCKRGREELRVEVKGTTGEGSKVVLTKNEVVQMKPEGYALFVVSDVDLDRTVPDRPTAYGGTCVLFHPWVTERHRFEPIAYSCQLDLEAGLLVNL